MFPLRRITYSTGYYHDFRLPPTIHIAYFLNIFNPFFLSLLWATFNFPPPPPLSLRLSNQPSNLSYHNIITLNSYHFQITVVITIIMLIIVIKNSSTTFKFIGLSFLISPSHTKWVIICSFYYLALFCNLT